MSEVTTEWVAKAESDFATARILLEHGEENIVDMVCFHSQQCIEKYLKAFLNEHAINFPRDHSLPPLVKLCRTIDDQFEELWDDTASMEGYAVAIRYPGAVATRSMAENALAAAERVRAFIRNKLALPD